jgi:hypothetical protein
VIDICQACRCCNHCGTRHDGDQDEARCPLDPDVTKAEVEAMLRDAGITAEEQKRGFDSTMEMLNLYTANQRLTIERDNYCAALRICTDALLELGATDVLDLLVPHIGTPLNPKHSEPL